MTSRKTLNKLLISAVALTVAGASGAASAGGLFETSAPKSLIKVGMNGCEGKEGAKDHGDKAKKEKCYGVVKAGKNDCKANGHSCAAQAVADNDVSEFIIMPAGLCDKIAGGATSLSS